ncbi:hypothetical protein FMEAI12_1860005 [Parafrankia sp. Ea1.12]|nr:hypothetical protein FMEAI12_1860005 [Parafrankia sp. Ea1.12]
MAAPRPSSRTSVLVSGSPAPPLFLDDFHGSGRVVEDDHGLAGFLVAFPSPSQPRVAYIHFAGLQRPRTTHGDFPALSDGRFVAQHLTSTHMRAPNWSFSRTREHPEAGSRANQRVRRAPGQVDAGGRRRLSPLPGRRPRGLPGPGAHDGPA